MCRDISIAELEPCLGTEFLQLLQNRKGVVLNTPPFCTGSLIPASVYMIGIEVR